METLLSLGLHKQAEQLYKDFRVPDKRCVTEAALLLALSFTTVFPVCPSRLSVPLACLPLSPVCLSHLCRYWWLKLKSLAEKEEWDELEKFSKSKKSPIGYLVRRSPTPSVMLH